VFGGAPVINAFLTIFMARRLKEIGPLFLAGLVIVILGVLVVLFTRPYADPHAKAATATAQSGTTPDSTNAAAESSAARGSFMTWTYRLLAIALAVLSWGAYGPVLHKGQAAMHHSRLRPLICVGIAYIVIAVIAPYFFLGEVGENSTYRSIGTLWSFIAGAIAAIGALGIVMAFNFGGRPVFVMPLVFGLAPVVNTFFSVSSHGQWDEINPFFWAGLILVIAGSVMVLVLAPRGEPGQVAKTPATEEGGAAGGSVATT
jgi:hypothetical protein